MIAPIFAGKDTHVGCQIEPLRPLGMNRNVADWCLRQGATDIRPTLPTVGCASEIIRLKTAVGRVDQIVVVGIDGDGQTLAVGVDAIGVDLLPGGIGRRAIG